MRNQNVQIIKKFDVALPVATPLRPRADCVRFAFCLLRTLLSSLHLSLFLHTNFCFHSTLGNNIVSWSFFSGCRSRIPPLVDRMAWQLSL